jgi:urease accessory protein
MSLQSMELLQLADACFPSGGFAFSNGLESLAKLGYMKRMEDFREYLECHLDQITSSEIPFLNSAFGQVEPETEHGREDAHCRLGSGFESVAMEWDAWMFLPSQRRGSLAQGQAWSRAMEEAYDMPSIRAVRPWFMRGKLPLHFLMVLAATLKAAGVSLYDAQSLLLHMALRDQLGAAVRLGLLGSLQAQKLHREYIRIGEEFRRLRGDWEYGQSVRSAPMIDLGQASHPHLYSKLFQS